MPKKHILSLVSSVLALALAFASLAWARSRRDHHVKRASSDLSFIVSPKANEVCFSPEEPCDLKLVKFVQEAEKSLDVAIYDINLDQLVHSLAMQARKIPVRVVVDYRQSKGEHSLVNVLAKAGVNVRFGRQRGIMHNKFILRDGTFLETGSFNFTHHAYTANNENQIYLNTPEVVARYKARFERIWDEARPVIANVPQAVTPKAAKGG